MDFSDLSLNIYNHHRLLHENQSTHRVPGSSASFQMISTDSPPPDNTTNPSTPSTTPFMIDIASAALTGPPQLVASSYPPKVRFAMYANQTVFTESFKFVTQNARTWELYPNIMACFARSGVNSAMVAAKLFAQDYYDDPQLGLVAATLSSTVMNHFFIEPTQFPRYLPPFSNYNLRALPATLLRETFFTTALLSNYNPYRSFFDHFLENNTSRLVSEVSYGATVGALTTPHDIISSYLRNGYSPQEVLKTIKETPSLLMRGPQYERLKLQLA